METNELIQQLSKMRNNAPEGEKSTVPHIFGIRYTDELKDLKIEELKDIVIAAGLCESLAFEIRKGVKIALSDDNIYAVYNKKSVL